MSSFPDCVDTLISVNKISIYRLTTAQLCSEICYMAESLGCKSHSSLLALKGQIF